MSNNDNSYIQKPIDLKHLFFEIIKRWYLLTAIIILCVLSSLVYSKFIATPLYDSTAKIYIMNKSSGNLSASDISVSTYLAKDYEELIVDRAVLGEVSKKMKNNFSYEFLKSSITIVNPESTRFLVITVRTDNAANSKAIVDKICEVSQEKIPTLMGVDRVTIIGEGNIPKSPSSPDLKLYILKSFIVGIIISAILVFIIYYQDDKINEPQDIEKYLKLSVLGIIPYNSNRAKAK